MVTVKSEICLDRGQFAGGAKNLQDQCAAVIYPPKDCQYDKVSSWILDKICSNASYCSEMYAIS